MTPAKSATVGRKSDSPSSIPWAPRTGQDIAPTPSKAPLLALHFDDVRAEEVTPSYAGSSSRVDFYLPDARLMVEVKMTRDSLRQRGVVSQLTEDAARYAAKDDVDTLVCLVYDPGGFCHNPTALERDVQESGRKLSVHALVCPRGM